MLINTDTDNPMTNMMELDIFLFLNPFSVKKSHAFSVCNDVKISDIMTYYCSKNEIFDKIIS